MRSKLFALGAALALVACADEKAIITKPMITYVAPPPVECPDTTVPIPKAGDKSDAATDWVTDLWATKRICKKSADISNKTREEMLKKAKEDPDGSVIDTLPPPKESTPR